jgi:hypothetical protein
MFLHSNNVGQSLRDCKIFDDTSSERSCDQGVFMEYAIGDRDHLIDPKNATTIPMMQLCTQIQDDTMRDFCAYYLADDFFIKQSIEFLPSEEDSYDDLDENTFKKIQAT